MRDAEPYLKRLDLLEPPAVHTPASGHRVLEHIDDETPIDHPRQRLAAALVAFIVFGAAATLALQAFDTGNGTDRPSVSAAPQPTGTWLRLPDPPVEYRHRAAGFWVDGKMVMIGGSDEAPTCPRFANCATRATPLPLDGAAFDPVQNSWTTISASPLPVMTYSGAVVGDTLYVWGSEGGATPASLLAYHAAEDRWEEIDIPPELSEAHGALKLAAAGDLLVAYPESQEQGLYPDYIFDPSTGRSRQLTFDPLAPTFDRAIVWTGEELVLLGIEIGLRGEDEHNLYRAASFDLSTGTWTSLPDTGIAGYNPTWFWTADRIVNPALGRVGDGGSVPGTGPPFGGFVDPSTGRWSELPPAPRHPVPYGGPTVGGDRFVVTEQGAILDVASSSWQPLPAAPERADEGAVAVWAGDRLVVWGGVRWPAAQRELDCDGGTCVAAHTEMVRAGWAWIPDPV